MKNAFSLVEPKRSEAPAKAGVHLPQGFSLVELSIVLVILGLLTGGILAGQSLIRAAELRSVSTEYNRYITAVQTFRDKYFAIPGDMATATSFWTASGTCPGTSAAPQTGATACNGNGSGLIERAATNSNETFGFWKHLANGGLIEGSYTGVPNSTTASDLLSVGGSNVPASKLNNAVWTVYNFNTIAVSDTNYIEGDYTNSLWFGAVSSAATGLSIGAIIRPEEAWNIDTKMDDGKPGMGAIRIASEGMTTCFDLADGSAGSASNSAARTDIQYNLDNSGIACALVLRGAR